jgi:predicted alpha/beta hydrolase family esterase
VIIIHGLQGHPLKTWLYTTPTKRSRLSLTRLFGRKKATSKELAEEPTTTESASLDSSNKLETYWPNDLLPIQCPQARILVWGYDTMVTRGPGQAANKSSVFAHGQNLLFSLNRERPRRTPIIFIAHSLGGVLVKEMLSYAGASKEPQFLEIVEDVSAVVFLGTPHRGSGAAHIGDIARQVLSALRIDTSPGVLDSLGLRNDDLVRSQQSFARIWDERRFEVKTFQESKGMGGIKIGILNKLVGF